jgi:hypothetical protein
MMVDCSRAGEFPGPNRQSSILNIEDRLRTGDGAYFCSGREFSPAGWRDRQGRIGNDQDDEGWTASADWLRDRFNLGAGAGNFQPGTSPVRSRLSANLRNSRATGLGPYSATASFTVTATPSSESLAFSCRSNQCLIDNATCATSCLNKLLHRWLAPRPEDAPS